MTWIVRIVLLAALFLVSASTRAQETITLLPYSNEAYGIESVAPEGWEDVGQGVFARRRDEGDPVLIAQQSAPLRPIAFPLPAAIGKRKPHPLRGVDGSPVLWLGPACVTWSKSRTDQDSPDGTHPFVTTILPVM